MVLFLIPHQWLFYIFQEAINLYFSESSILYQFKRTLFLWNFKFPHYSLGEFLMTWNYFQLINIDINVIFIIFYFRPSSKAPAPLPPGKSQENILIYDSDVNENTQIVSNHDALVYQYGKDKKWSPITNNYVSLVFLDCGGNDLANRYRIDIIENRKKVFVILNMFFLSCWAEQNTVAAFLWRVNSSVIMQKGES